MLARTEAGHNASQATPAIALAAPQHGAARHGERVSR